jgi:hypothetical protein
MTYYGFDDFKLIALNHGLDADSASETEKGDGETVGYYCCLRDILFVCGKNCVLSRLTADFDQTFRVDLRSARRENAEGGFSNLQVLHMSVLTLISSVQGCICWWRRCSSMCRMRRMACPVATPRQSPSRERNGLKMLEFACPSLLASDPSLGVGRALQVGHARL